MDNKAVNAFAGRYLSLYKDPVTKERDISRTFADECFELGFRMDCGKKFNETYGSINNPFETVSDKVDDVEILASGIFSKWRYITHWSYCDSCLDEENRKWFIQAFEKLLELTEDFV